MDILLSACALVTAAPLMLLIAVAILLDSGLPIFFLQSRAGPDGRHVRIRKFRTLTQSAPSNAVTPEGASSVTRCGILLRRYRLDELPQLIDVLAGRLALVGPRPELPEDLVAVPASTRERFLAIKPGLTGPVQLEFIEEDTLLAGFEDPTHTYRRCLVPAKVERNLRVFAEPSIWRELACLPRTVWVLCSPRARARSRARIEELLRGHPGGAERLRKP